MGGQSLKIGLGQPFLRSSGEFATGAVRRGGEVEGMLKKRRVCRVSGLASGMTSTSPQPSRVRQQSRCLGFVLLAKTDAVIVTGRDRM